MLSTLCGGAEKWWQNPRFQIQLQESTNLTITLSQPNTKVLGLAREQFDVEMGFRVVMDVLFPEGPRGAGQRDVRVDHGDPNLRTIAPVTATVPDFADGLFDGLAEPINLVVAESKLSFVIAHVPCETNRQVCTPPQHSTQYNTELTTTHNTQQHGTHNKAEPTTQGSPLQHRTTPQLNSIIRYSCVSQHRFTV